MTAPLIEPCSAAHVPLLAALHGRCFDQPWAEAAIADLMAMPGAFALVAADGTEPRGFVLCRSAADECEVITLCVVPETRGRGTGRLLVEVACETARDRGARRMFLEVAEDNAAAQALYVRTGFSEDGRRVAYYARADGTRADALILSRTL